MSAYSETPFRNAAKTKNPEAVLSLRDHQLVDTYHQDQATQALVAYFNQIQNSTTLAVDALKNADQITLTSATGAIVDRYIILFNPLTVRFYIGRIIAVVGTLITLDTQLDSDFPAGTNVDLCITNMNVDGSITRQTFGLRGAGIIPGIDLTFDITRIIMTCYTTSAVDLSTFGDLEKLTRGLVLRERNGETYNIFNVKSNGEIAGITLDWVPYDAANLQQGQFGFVSRLTFNGNEKMGVVKKLAIGEDLEFIIQDDLTDLLLLQCVAQGHVVED